MELATIEPRYDRNPLTGDTYLTGFDWIGDPCAPARIGLDLWKYSQDKGMIPWKLEILREDYFWAIVCRVDVPVPSYAYHRFEADALRLTDMLKGFGARLVLTAQVWGCAYVPMGAYPSWEHLFCRHPMNR